MTEKLDLNGATVEELSKVPMIGEAKADAIIRYRDANGPFKDIKDIKHVPGFSDKLADGLDMYFEVL